MSADLFEALFEALAAEDRDALVSAAEALLAAEERGQVVALPARPGRADGARRTLADRVVDARFVRDWTDERRSPEKAADLTARDGYVRQILTDEDAAGSAGHLAREIRTLVSDYDGALRRLIDSHAYTLRQLHEHGLVEARRGFSSTDHDQIYVDQLPGRLEAILQTVTAWANVRQDEGEAPDA